MGVNSCGTTLIDQGVFKNIGAITWDTTVKTSGFTAVSGNGYFCNTTSAAFTVTLPASPSAGDVVAIADYANTADTNNITIGRNGSNIQGNASDFVISTEGLSITLIYVDGTKGWLSIDAAQASDIAEQALFTVATGGTITTSGNFKIHTFTGPGTFTVSQLGNCAGGGSNVDYLAVAGGGGGGANISGGGGAGGFRTSFPSPAGTVPVAVQGYPITVGAGGAGSPAPTSAKGTTGSNSVFSTITSSGGGGGGARNSPGGPNLDGGSGGGGGIVDGIPSAVTAGSGNIPPVSPPQGNPGGDNQGGGGGASSAGTNAAPNGGTGGSGTANSISGGSVTYAGGGGGGGFAPQGRTGGAGGPGGGGAGSTSGTATAGTANRGGGGGGGGAPGGNGGSGGSGIVIIRYKFQ